MNTCVSDFALDDLEIHGPKASEVERHLQDCERCQSRRQARADAVGRFREAWADDVWKAVVRRQGRKKRRSLLGWFGIPVLAVGASAAVALLVVVPRGPSGPSPSQGGYWAAKGRAVAEVFCRRGERTFPLAPGDEVRPGDELRFRPLPVWPEARYVQIGSVDGTGTFTSFYPATTGAGTESVPFPRDGDALPGSIRLDDAPGPERLLVVLSDRPLASEDFRRAAEAGAPAQSDLRRIGDAPVVAGWITLSKRPTSAP